MIAPPPESIREALIESVPIVIGRVDEAGLVREIEGSIPRSGALDQLIPGQTNLLELLPDEADRIEAALHQGYADLFIQTADEKGPAHFELRVIFDQRRGQGAYFLIHDVTDTRELHIALLNCTDREQTRIGQDLHDTLGQELTGVSYRLHAIRETAPPAFAKELDVLQEQISGCLERSRDIAFKLSPQIDGPEIAAAFDRLCRHFKEAFEVDCVFTSDLATPISDSDVAFNLFRIAQEACTNALRHGGARHIRIHLVTGPENRIEISDDGTGIDPARRTDIPGMGVPTMKFRAEAIGGSLRLLTGASGGTIVRCRFANRHSLEAQPPISEKPCETCS